MPLISTATVSRAAPLTTTPLSLVTGAYQVAGADGLTPGGVTWDKKVASSPWVHGDRPVHQRKQQSRGSLKIRVTAANMSALTTAIGTLLDAFYQFEYQVSVTFEGTATFTWRCYAADATVGMADERWMQHNVEVVLMFDRSPTPVAGAV